MHGLLARLVAATRCRSRAPQSSLPHSPKLLRLKKILTQSYQPNESTAMRPKDLNQTQRHVMPPRSCLVHQEDHPSPDASSQPRKGPRSRGVSFSESNSQITDGYSFHPHVLSQHSEWDPPDQPLQDTRRMMNLPPGIQPKKSSLRVPRPSIPPEHSFDPAGIQPSISKWVAEHASSIDHNARDVKKLNLKDLSYRDYLSRAHYGGPRCIKFIVDNPASEPEEWPPGYGLPLVDNNLMGIPHYPGPECRNWPGRYLPATPTHPPRLYKVKRRWPFKLYNM